MHAVNGEGETPYQISQAFGYGEIADLLLGHGEGKGEQGSTKSLLGSNAMSDWHFDFNS
jgi:hypothetical protein